MEAGSGAHPPAWSRPLRRLLRPFLNAEEKQRVRQAIADAERGTTGRIRIEIIARAGGRDLLELARLHFRKHPGNGHHVLVLISHLDHRFAIWGEADIDARSGRALWESASHALATRFRERRYADGIEECVRLIGRDLVRLFPKRDPHAR